MTAKRIRGKNARLLTAVLDAYTRALGVALPSRRRAATGGRTAAQRAAARANGARGGRRPTR